MPHREDRERLEDKDSQDLAKVTYFISLSPRHGYSIIAVLAA